MAEDEQTSADIQVKVNAAMRRRGREITDIKEEPNLKEKANKTTKLVRNVSREIGADENNENKVWSLVIPWLQ